MAPTVSIRDRLQRGESIDIRGDGKAGGGLVLAIQTFAVALSQTDLDVQDWPLFSSARKGANVRAYLRVAKGEVQTACLVTHPDVAVLMNEAAGDEVDFAEGTHAATYVVNTPRSPEEVAARYRLGGRVAVIAGDDLGNQFLNRPLGNVALFAALVRVTEAVEPDVARRALAQMLKKRRLPERIIDANLALFDAALERMRWAEVPATPQSDHRPKAFQGYGELPVGAQSSLRTSRRNHTAGYGRPGVKIVFEDAAHRCNGCSLCVVQCPEGIIQFEPDPAKGTLVHGANFDAYCKLCRECIAACPLDLFSEVPVVARPEHAA